MGKHICVFIGASADNRYIICMHVTSYEQANKQLRVPDRLVYRSKLSSQVAESGKLR